MNQDSGCCQEEIYDENNETFAEGFLSRHSLDTLGNISYSRFVKLKPQGPEFSCRVAEGTGPTTLRQPVEQQALHPVPIPAPSRGGTWEFRRRFPNTLTPDLKDRQRVALVHSCIREALLEFLHPQITGSGLSEGCDGRTFSIAMPRMRTFMGKYSAFILRRMSCAAGNYVRLRRASRPRDAREYYGASGKFVALPGFVAAAGKF
jgi:hypothetical protein